MSIIYANEYYCYRLWRIKMDIYYLRSSICHLSCKRQTDSRKQCIICSNMNVTAHWPASYAQTSAMQSFSADVSILWTMTYWYRPAVAPQSTLITKPTVTPTVIVPQTGYEVMSTAVVADGSSLGNPTWKLLRPFTTAVHTNVSSATRLIWFWRKAHF